MSFPNEASYFKKRLVFFMENGGLDKPQIFEFTEGVISRNSCADYSQGVIRQQCKGLILNKLSAISKTN